MLADFGVEELVPFPQAADSDIDAALPLSQPASSRHIAELVKGGLLKMRAHRSQVFYRRERKVLDQF